MSWLADMLSFAFVQRALIVGALISLCACLVGITLVLRKNSMLSDGLSHTAFGAIALATVLGFTSVWVAIPVVILASIFILRLHKNQHINGDAATALLSASSLAIGTLVVSVAGVNTDLNSFLFGSILSISWTDVWLAIGFTVFVILVYLFAHNQIFAITFDEDFAKSIGLKTGLYDTLFAIICSVTVVLGMQLLGALLISSLVIFPTLIASQFSRSFKGVIFVAVFVSLVNFLLGFAISFLAATPTGATIVLVNLAFLCLTKFILFWTKR